MRRISCAVAMLSLGSIGLRSCCWMRSWISLAFARANSEAGALRAERRSDMTWKRDVLFAHQRALLKFAPLRESAGHAVVVSCESRKRQYRYTAYFDERRERTCPKEQSRNSTGRRAIEE